MDEQGKLLLDLTHKNCTVTYVFFLDEMWLKIYNSERKKEKLGEVSGDLFENIIDKLEKEWFDLVSKKKKVIFYQLHY